MSSAPTLSQRGRAASPLLAAALLAPLSCLAEEIGTLIIPVAYDVEAEDAATGVVLGTAPTPGLYFPGQTLPQPGSLAPGEVRFFSYPFFSDSAGTLNTTLAYSASGGLWEREAAGDLPVAIAVAPSPPPAADSTPPATSRGFLGPTHLGGATIFVASHTRIQLQAVDHPSPEAPASGVAATRYLVDSAFIDTATTPGILYAGEPVALAPGPHVFSYYSVDAAGNVEPLKVSSITVDAAGPLISQLSPAGGEAFGSAVASFTVSWSVSDDWTPFSASGRLVQIEDRGVARGTAPAELAVTPGQNLQAAALDDGLWELRVSATDSVLNVSSRSSGPFQIVRPDFLPPRTALTIGSPSVPGNATFIGANTPIALSATDDLATLGDGVGTGIAYSSYSVDSESLFQAYSGTFSVPGDGPHVVRYFSADNAGNSEAVRVASVTADATAPTIGAFRPADGALSASSRPLVSAAFSDLLSGVSTATLSLTIDGQPVTTRIAAVPGGAFGPWEAGPGLNVALSHHRMAAAGNVVYVIAGRESGSSRSTYFSVVNSSGNLSPWQGGAGLDFPVEEPGVAVHGSFVYVMPQENWRVKRMPITATGALGPPVTVAEIPVQSGQFESAALLGSGDHLFVIAPDAAKSYSARIDANGNLGPWTVSAAPPQRPGSEMAEWGGRLYLVGGHNPSGTKREVYASVGAEDGVIDSWERLADLPDGRYDGALTVMDGRLVYVGGRKPNDQTSNSVFVAISSGGRISGWTEHQHPYPISTFQNGVAAVGNLIVGSGGRDPSTNIPTAATWVMRFAPDGATAHADVRSLETPALADGHHTLAASGADRLGNAANAAVGFTVDTTPPEAALSLDGAASAPGRLVASRQARPTFRVEYSDANLVDTATVRLLLDGAAVTASAAISAGAAVFTPPAALSPGRHVFAAEMSDKAGNRRVIANIVMIDSAPPSTALTLPRSGDIVGRRVAIGLSASDTDSGLSTASVRLSFDSASLPASLLFDEPTAPDRWRPETPLPVGVRDHRMAVWNGYLYVLGGHKSDGSVNAHTRGVYFAPIGTQGVVGAWTRTTDLPVPAAGHAVVAAKGHLYSIDGTGDSFSVFQYARISTTTGHLEGWNPGPALPMQYNGAEAAGITAVGDFIYLITGVLRESDRVFFCRLSSTGVPGSWIETTRLPRPRSGARLVSSGNKLFALGGLEGSDLTGLQDTVYIADAGPTGQLSPWRLASRLPGPRAYGAAAVVDGVLAYIAGGTSAGGAARFRQEVFLSPLGANGEPTGWMSAVEYPRAVWGLAPAVHGRAVYVSGGESGGPALRDHYAASFTDRVQTLAASGEATATEDGPRTVSALVEDAAGNASISSLTVTVDLTPPQTDLVALGSSLTVAGTLVTLPGTQFRLDAFDATAGVAAKFRSLDGGPLEATPGTFTVPVGTHSLAYGSVDAVDNEESPRTVAVKIDGTPPAAVTALAAAALSTHSIRLSWTAPGDDGFEGDILLSEVRLHVSTSPGPASTATAHVLVATGALSPGAALSRLVEGLSAGTSYYAAVFTRDSIGNWSATPALTAVRTFLLVTSTDSVASLATPSAADIVVVSTTTGTEAYAVAVASQALNLAVADFYELTDGLTFPPEAPATLSFYFNPLVTDLASVAIYTFDEATLEWSSASIANQTITLLGDTLAVISGEILHTSLYAPFVRDTAAPLTAFSILGSSAVLEGRLFGRGPSSAALSALDLAPRGGSASGVAGTFYALDGAPDSAYAGPFGLSEGVRRIAFYSVDRQGNAERRRLAEVQVDASPPAIAFSADVSTFPVPGGFGTLASTVTLTLTFEDLEREGVHAGLAEAGYAVDGATAAVAFAAGAASAAVSVTLGPGLHALDVAAADRVGLRGALTLRVAVGDTMAPVTALHIASPSFALADGSTLVAALTELNLGAEDFAESGAPSGVAATRLRIGDGAYVVQAGTFTLPMPDGPVMLQFFSTDHAGNAESPAKTARLERDSRAPALAISFPRPEDTGLCRLAQGAVAVRGTAADPHMKGWELSADGVRIGSGAASAAGLLGVWDAAGRSGESVLSLNAADLVANAAAVSRTLTAGPPARTLALGGKQVLNKPRGVAAAPDRIYVADTNADVVRAFDSAGTALAVLGGGKGPAKLNKPAGLALDASGNILVADANNKRVVKLSPAGVFLAEYGKGALQRPLAVALSAGRVVVADAKAGQLLVFADGGTLLARADLPPAPGPDDDLEEPRPVALAADAAGNVWAADAKGGRVLRYTPALVLAQTIPGFERPEGVAVSRSGACLAVSDAKSARIRTFDAELAGGLAAFGLHGEIKPDKPLPDEFFLNKPAQLAFTAAGTLLVADRNNDLVQGFGLPGAPAVVALGSRPGGGTRLAAADGDAGLVTASARVGRFEGGRVAHPDGAAVEIPAGALAADLDVAVAKAPESGDAHRAREAARTLAGLAAGSVAREFSPHGLAFSAPAAITLPYDPLLVSAPRELKIHYWNAERGVWEALASEVDEGARTVSARVAHFSVYQVLAPVQALSALADPEAGFAFRASYAFPNPAVGGQKPTVHVAVGRADKVTVRFYDIAGTPVHEATLDAPSVVSDESGPHWAYEYAWAGHIPSGVYLYAVTAEKAGHAPIKRIGKLAVVR